MCSTYIWAILMIIKFLFRWEHIDITHWKVAQVPVLIFIACQSYRYDLYFSGTHSCSLIDSLSIHTWVNWTQTASGVFKGYKTTKRKTKTTQQGVACEPPTTSGNCVSSACDRVCMECKQYMQMDKARLQENLLWLLECISLYLHA